MPIFDQGYQHWSGELSGHAFRWLAVTRHGIRVGKKSRFLRYVLYIAWIPALALVLMLCMWGLLERGSSIAATFSSLMAMMSPNLVANPRYYRVDMWRLSYSYFLAVELRFSMILILLAGPSLISQDLRFNALPLYFSRPLRRIDYFLGKLGVIVAFLGMVMVVPSVVAYILGLLFSLDISIIRDTFSILLGSVAYGLIIAVSAGLLILALSALSRNSRYIALFWIAMWFVTSITSTVLQSVDSEQRRQVYFSQISVPRPDFRNDTLSRDERTRQIRQWRAAREAADEKYRTAELEFSKDDWRPLVSYVSNLSRVGQQLLRTDESWRRLSLIAPSPDARDRLLTVFMGPQYPWYWSAVVLIGLFGFSVCMLNFSIKSLDRLK